MFGSVGRTNGDLDASAPCDSDVMSASQLGSTKDFIMMPPAEKLTHFDRRAQVHEDNQEVGVHFTAWKAMGKTKSYIV